MASVVPKAAAAVKGEPFRESVMDYKVEAKDLLSFAGQIASGMVSYSKSKGLYTRKGHATAIIPCVPSKIQIQSKNSNIISILSIGIVQSIQLRLL